MPLFVMIGRDGPAGAAARDRNRAGHVAHLDALEADGRIVFAGPVRDEADERSIGAVIVFEAESLEAARDLVARDPYVEGGVFETWSVRPFRRAYPRQG
jgi:uncharacterized protein YciI